MQPAERHHYTEDEYVELERSAETKSELVNGEIFAMAGARPRHNALAANVMIALGGRLRAQGSPRVFPADDEVMGLVGKSCIPADQICASNNGCGGCSVTCKNGVWASTDADLCFSVGGAC